MTDTRVAFDRGMLRLVGITDSLRDGIDGLVARALAAAHGGVTMVQVRLEAENARVLADVTQALRAAIPAIQIIVSSRLDVALAANAHGVHLGTDDIAPAAVRRVVPPGFIIGVSVSDSHEVARAAAADYVAIGPVFGMATASGGSAMGLERFVELAVNCGRPAVAIGGLSVENADEVMSAGASGIAVISALFGAPDPERAAHQLRRILDASGM